MCAIIVAGAQTPAVQACEMSGRLSERQEPLLDAHRGDSIKTLCCIVNPLVCSRVLRRRIFLLAGKAVVP